MRLTFGLASVLISAMTGVSAQSPGRDRPGRAEPSVVFRVPAEVNTSDLEITFLLAGGFGGYGSVIMGAPNVQDYALETSRDDKPASSLKAYAYAPGFGFTFVTVDLTRGTLSRTIPLPFQRLGTIRATGRVAGQTGQSLDGLRILATYDRPWHCEFFGLPDCFMSLGRTSASLAANGSFVLELPDFARDPGLVPFAHKGGFSFSAQDASGASLPLVGELARLPLADRYDQVLEFRRLWTRSP